MAIVESRDLNGAASKVAIGPPVINDGNIADLGRDHISYLAKFRKTCFPLASRFWTLTDFPKL